MQVRKVSQVPSVTHRVFAYFFELVAQTAHSGMPLTPDRSGTLAYRSSSLKAADPESGLQGSRNHSPPRTRPQSAIHKRQWLPGVLFGALCLSVLVVVVLRGNSGSSEGRAGGQASVQGNFVSDKNVSVGSCSTFLALTMARLPGGRTFCWVLSQVLTINLNRRPCACQLLIL